MGAVTAALDATLRRFPAIALEALGAAQLLDRIDTKFLVDAGAVDALLAACVADYEVLDIAGHRRFRYETTYLDDEALALFRAHIAARPERCKVRTRRYAPSGERWFEVKQRLRTGRTIKVRVPLPDGAPLPALEAPPFDAVPVGVPSGALRPILDVLYERITLVARDRSERVTVDLELAWDRAGRRVVAPGWALVELKQAARRTSAAWRALRAFGAVDESVSKYCLGVVALVPDVPPGYYRQLLKRMGARGDLAASGPVTAVPTEPIV